DPTCSPAEGVGGVLKEYKSATGGAKALLENAIFNANPKATEENPLKGYKSIDAKVLSKALVSAWLQGHRLGMQEHLPAVERAIHHVGGEKLLREGEQIKFGEHWDEQPHEQIHGEAGVSRGTSVRVVRSGWNLGHYVVPAQVTANCGGVGGTPGPCPEN